MHTNLVLQILAATSQLARTSDEAMPSSERIAALELELQAVIEERDEARRLAALLREELEACERRRLEQAAVGMEVREFAQRAERLAMRLQRTVTDRD